MRLGGWLLMTASTLALAGAAGASVTVSGGGFETPEVGAGYVYAPTGSPVTYTAHSGVAGNGSAWGFASAPEGDQVAFLQIGPSPPTISLAVSGLTAGTSYVATFRIVARPGYESLPLTVAFDGVPLGTFTPASTTFAAKVSAPFTAGSGSGTLTFTGGNYSVERSTGLDNVRVATAGNEIVTFSYDALGRLAGTSTAGGPNTGSTASAGYDAAGNRTVYAMSVSGAPAFSVSEAAAVEGGGLVFTVVKNGTGAASVSYATAGGTAGGGDFHGASGGLSFAAGESAKTVAVATVDDASDEPGETLSLNLSGPSAGSTVADGQGIGTIFDNDEPPPPPPPPPPSFSVGDASVTEGGILVFTVTKTGPAVQVFAVDFATAGGTATGTYSGNGDYYTGSARLYFQPAETSRTVSIHTIEDPMDEPNETVSLNLSNASGGASITDAQAIGTILDNDEQPAGNIPPTPQDDTGTQKACSLKTYYVLANDTDPDGHTPLTIIGSSHPSFTAGSNAIEVDSSNIASGEFTTYTVRDTAGATATARLTVYLTAGNCGSNQ